MPETHTPEQRPLLNVTELCKLLGISRWKYYAMARTGALDRLRAPAPLGNKFSRAKVMKWLDGHAYRQSA